MTMRTLVSVVIGTVLTATRLWAGGLPFQVNSVNSDAQTPQIAADPAGHFTVVWQSFDTNPPNLFAVRASSKSKAS
jgi:hypothetical protein